MPILNEGKYTAEFLLHEANGSLSRSEVTFAAAAPAMVSGELVGKITASGKFTKYIDSNSDGSQTCVGILYRALPDVAADQKGVIIDYHAEVLGSALTGLDANGTADLLALKIKVR